MKNYSILLVDDEQNVLESLARILEDNNYTVFKASSADCGLKILKENDTISLVISDCRMPEKDGIEFLAEVKEYNKDIIRILITGFADMESTIGAINKGNIYRYISKPWNDEELLVIIKNGLEYYELINENKVLHAKTIKQNEQLKEWNETLEQKVKARTKEIQEKNIALSTAYKELEKGLIDFVKLAGTFVQIKDNFLGNHSRRVAAMAKNIAKYMNLNEQEILELEIAALLHDIGIIGIPDNIIKKEEIYLSEQEKNILKRHTIIGQTCLQNIEKFKTIGKIIRHHHEHFNGTGYPDKLKGENIPLSSRIIYICDTYDSMLNHKNNSMASSVEKVLKYIEYNSGIEFDPNITKHFLKFIKDTCQRLKNTNEIEISPNQLKSEMVLTRKLQTTDGITLLEKGTRITKKDIEHINNLTVLDPINTGIYVKKNTGY